MPIFWFCLLAIFLALARRAEEEEKWVEGGGMPDVRADIPVTVLQVPAGEEGGPGELLNIIKEEKEEEMEGNWRDEEEIQGDLLVEVVLIINFLLVPFPLVSFHCSSCADNFPPKKKYNNHIVKMHKDPTSC